MESMKTKLGILLLILSLAIIIGAVWYCLFGLPDSSTMKDGTLVQGISTIGKMMNL